MRPWRLNWSDAELARVIRRVADTRLPPAPENSGWSLGCDADFLAKLQAHWVQGYDPAAAISELNRYPQFLASVEGLDIHFVRVTGENPGARPLLLTHGWPGSHLEFWDVIEPLAFPSRHGGEAHDAFDLVIPSLPGFGFSAKPVQPIGPRTTARLWNVLMTQALGFETYFGQGGDWGAIVTAWLGIDHPASVRSIHLNMMPLLQTVASVDEAGEAWLRHGRNQMKRFGDYLRLQTRKPQSIAWAAADNPLGQAAWIVERFHDWTDLDGRPLDAVFTLDQLISNVMIYVMTDSFASGAWYYNGMSLETRASDIAHPRCEVPTAYAAFPGDPLFAPPPRNLAEGVYNIRRWTEMPRGGHFAALQEPALFVDDLRAWAGDLT